MTVSKLAFSFRSCKISDFKRSFSLRRAATEFGSERSDELCRRPFSSSSCLSKMSILRVVSEHLLRERERERER